MRQELDLLYQIDRYLNREMSSSEKKLFEIKISEDTNLAEEVAHQKSLNEAIEGVMIGNIQSQIKSDIEKFDIKANRIRKLSLLGVIIFIAFLSIIIISYKSTEIKKNDVKLPLKKGIVNFNNISNAPELKVKNYSEKYLENKPKPLHISKLTAPINIQNNILHKKHVQNVETIEVKSDGIHKVKGINSNKDSLLNIELDNGCEGFQILSNPMIEASCRGSHTGKVYFDLSSIQGGENPYSIKLVESNEVISNNRFENMASGEHSFIITDTKGCNEKVMVIIPEEDCLQSNFIINTSAGERWQIPATKNDYWLELLDRNGRIVLKIHSSVLNQNQFEGIDAHGAYLDSDLYIYTITYSDGTKQNGQLSIIK